MGITKFVLRRPVTTILAILCLAVFGYQSIVGTKLELSPDMDMSMMIVLTTYLGASPEDVNELITKPIEEKVNTLSGLDSVSSTSSEGTSMIMLAYKHGTDMNEAYDDLKKQVDMMTNSLPDDAGTPTIVEMNTKSAVDMTLIIDHPGKENLYDYVNNEIVPQFEKISSAAEVSITGGTQEYIKIELVEEKMKQYGVTISSIAGDIKAAEVTYPAGTTKRGSQEVSVSTRMSFNAQDVLKDIPLTTSNNDIVFLADVANVYKNSNTEDSVARYNGKDTTSVSITRQQSATSMELSTAAQNTISSLTRQDPGLNIVIVSDNAESIKSSLWSVVETLLLAVIISMVIIWLFFGDIKASLIVGSSIPVSILSSLIAMNMMGLSLNVITLCALTLGVGMMVDNSIVVLESCFRVTEDNQKAGFVEYLKDALEGTNIVASSVAASTVTTCVVFLPLALLTGMTGQLFGPLGFTIVFCMAASLLSSVAVVPLCYMLYRPKEKEKAPLSKPMVKLQDVYRSAMRVILPKKKTVIFVSLLLLVGSFLLAAQLQMELMASDDQGQISISVETRPGLVTAEIDKILVQIEEIIAAHPDRDAYMTTSGGSMMRGGGASISVYLKDDREMSTAEVASQWKRELQDITNCDISVGVSGSMSMMSSFDQSFDTIIQGADYEEVKQVTNDIVQDLMQRPEVTKVHSDAENSSPVVEVSVDAIKARAAGLTASAIGSTLNQMLSGMEATELDVDGNKISVMVEYPEGTYETLDQVKGIVLTTGSGGSVLLTDVADVGFQDSPASIRRENKQYKITISAEYTDQATEQSKMILPREVVTPHLTERVTTGMNSMDQSMNNEFTALFSAIAIAIFLIFVVMAAQFESPKFSLMVMTTIPFSLIGSFGLLWLTDCKISMVSLVGFLMLFGTVVNAGILYVDTVNQYRETMDRDTALIEAGATRLRPILMTTLTTILAMIPMAMAWGSSGAMTQGLAIVNIGGLTASTFLSLLMLPVFYSIMSRTPQEEKARQKKKLRKEEFDDVD